MGGIGGGRYLHRHLFIGLFAPRCAEVVPRLKADAVGSGQWPRSAHSGQISGVSGIDRALRFKVSVFNIAYLAIRKVNHAAPSVRIIGQTAMQNTIVKDKA